MATATQGATSGGKPATVDMLVPRAIREVAERLVFRKLAAVLIAALAGVAALQGLAALAILSRAPRTVYVPESTLVRPRDVR